MFMCFFWPLDKAVTKLKALATHNLLEARTQRKGPPQLPNGDPGTGLSRPMGELKTLLASLFGPYDYRAFKANGRA